MRILWINPVGTQVFDADTVRILNEAKRADTQVDVVSLPGSAITSQKSRRSTNDSTSCTSKPIPFDWSHR